MQLLQKKSIYLLTLMICIGMSKQSVVIPAEKPQDDLTSTIKPVNNSEVNHRKGRCELRNNKNIL